MLLEHNFPRSSPQKNNVSVRWAQNIGHSTRPSLYIIGMMAYLDSPHRDVGAHKRRFFLEVY